MATGDVNYFAFALLILSDAKLGNSPTRGAAYFLNAGVTIPMHFDTFGWIEVDENDFVRRVEAGGRKAKIVKPGSTHRL